MKIKPILLTLLVLLVLCLSWWRWGYVPKKETDKPNWADTRHSDKKPSRETIQQIEQAKNDPRLRMLFAHPTSRTPLWTLRTLRESDEAVLLAAYKNTTNLLERTSLTWALAYIGSDASFAALKHTLTDEFKGQLITSHSYSETTSETDLMFNTVEALGLMAARNDAAFAFLQQGADPWFWQRSVGWKSHQGPSDYGLLTSRAIRAIGMSGHKEVPDILEALSKQPLENSPDPANGRRTFNGAVCRAAFENAFIRDRGREAFLEWWDFKFDDDAGVNDGGRKQWQATPEGKKWTEWRDKFDQEKLAQRKAANRWP